MPDFTSVASNSTSTNAFADDRTATGIKSAARHCRLTGITESARILIAAD